MRKNCVPSGFKVPLIIEIYINDTIDTIDAVVTFAEHIGKAERKIITSVVAE
jgi:hypothetical protein